MNYSYIFYRFDVIKMQIKHSSIIILLSGLAISPSVQSCKLYCLYIVVIAVHVLCIKTWSMFYVPPNQTNAYQRI